MLASFLSRFHPSLSNPLVRTQQVPGPLYSVVWLERAIWKQCRWTWYCSHLWNTSKKTWTRSSPRAWQLGNTRRGPAPPLISLLLPAPRTSSALAPVVAPHGFDGFAFDRGTTRRRRVRAPVWTVEMVDKMTRKFKSKFKTYAGGWVRGLQFY